MFTAGSGDRIVDTQVAPVRTYIVLADAIRPISFHHLLVSSYEHDLTTTIVELIYVSPAKTPAHQQL
jgi:hypothetical protein